MSWYLADLVVRLAVGDDPRGVVHVNTCLVEAVTPEEAHEKALRLGRSEDDDYDNAAGQRVRSRFLGLKELVEIHDPLEDGAELAWHQQVGRSELEAQRLVRRRGDLAVFRARVPSGGPDYAHGDVVAEADALAGARLVSIHHARITLPPGGEAAARRFYITLLGMRELDNPGERGELWLWAGDRRLHIDSKPAAADRGTTRARVAYEVTKLSEWRDRLTASGVEILADGDLGPGLRCLELRDPFGNRVELVERVRRDVGSSP